MDIRRRDVLLAAAAVGCGVSGCLHGGSGGEGGAPDAPGYTTWIYDPEVAGQDVSQHIFSYSEPASIPEAARGQGSTSIIAPSEFDLYTEFVSVRGFDGANVFGYASEEVFERALSDRGIDSAEPDERRDGFEIYRGLEYGQGEADFGVGRETMSIVETANEGVVGAMVDTRIGDAEPYTEADEDLGLLTRRLGEGHLVEGGARGFSGGEAAGVLRNGREDGTLEMRAVEVFGTEDAVDLAAFEEGVVETLRTDGGVLRESIEVGSTERVGRSAVATGTVDRSIRI